MHNKMHIVHKNSASGAISSTNKQSPDHRPPVEWASLGLDEEKDETVTLMDERLAPDSPIASEATVPLLRCSGGRANAGIERRRSRPSRMNC